MDAPADLSRQFAALLGGAHHDEPGTLLGLEQEFVVRTPSASPAHFGDLLTDLAIASDPLDPGDPNARRCRSGVVVTADGPEAEAATPPIAVRPGFPEDVAAWARIARRELEELLPVSYSLSGYSTHLSVCIDDARNTRVGALYSRTFAPGLILLMDRATSPGLIIRPRPGRTELCAEFVDGPWLRAAAAYAVGSVLACRDAITGTRSLRSLPPQLDVDVQPAAPRAGWYVDRTAFGTDLLGHGRTTRLRRCAGGSIVAQQHFELAWQAARSSLDGRASADDVAVVDDMVRGARPLALEAPVDELDAPQAGPLPAPSPLGAVNGTRMRPAFMIAAVAATWKATVFRVTSRRRERSAYAVVPRAHLGRFFELLDAGELDRVLDGYLTLEPSDRTVAMSGTEPALGDLPPTGASVVDRELDDQLVATLPGALVRAAKGIATAVADEVEEVTPRGCRPTLRWLTLFVVIAVLVVAGGVYALVGGGGGKEGPTPTTSAPAPTPGSGGCGTGTDGPQIALDVLGKCVFIHTQLVGPGRSYPVYEPAYGGATVVVAPPTTQFRFGTPCPVHNATQGIPAAGLQPGGTLDVVLTDPSGRTHLGHGVVDQDGYVEARVPINVKTTYKVEVAIYHADGNPNGAPRTIPSTDIVPNGVIDAAVAGFRCDRAATLALAPRRKSTGVAQAAKNAIVDSASLFPMTLLLAHPGDVIDQGGSWTVTPEGDVYGVHDAGMSFDLQPVTSSVGKGAGDIPTSVYYHGAAIIGPSSPDAAVAWQRELPCGSNQLALTVCTDTARDLVDGTYVAVAAVFGQPVPLVPRKDVRYSFEVGGKTFDLRFDESKRKRGVEAWSLSGPDDRARAMIRNNVVLLIASQDAVGNGNYRISTQVGRTTETQPPASDPPAPARTTIAVAPVPPAVRDANAKFESSEQFVAALGRAITVNDSQFVRTRLHPAVIDRYGSAACDAFVATPGGPVTLIPRKTGPPSVYKWQTDGLSRDIPNTNEVAVTETAGRQTQDRTVHVARV
ncbi:MAG: hypothetical protein E6G14_15650, partial [Actinobacteria bacterium]